MPVQVVKMFDPFLLESVAATLYTVPSGSGSIVLGRARIRFTNITSLQAFVTAYGVPSGSGAGPQNAFSMNLGIVANSYVDVDVPQLSAGGYIVAAAGTSGAIVVHSMDAVLFS